MSDTQEVSEHAVELADELDADPDEVEERLRNLLEYSVPLEEAERTVRRRYGSEGTEPSTPETKDIADLSPSDSRVTVEAVVLSAGRRSIRVSGDETVITEGELADETAFMTLLVTDWPSETRHLVIENTVKIVEPGLPDRTHVLEGQLEFK